MTDAVLGLAGLTKSFGGLTACNAVSLELRPGEIHALIGPNGAGKSTLMKLIDGTLAPDRGSVRFAGRDVTALPVPARARLGMGRTFQVSSLPMDYSVLQNVMIGALGTQGRVHRLFRPAMKDADLLAIAGEALERAGLAGLRNERAGELSHGQRRQLEVAVALAQKPKALLMDEPMAGLGQEGSLHLTRLLDGMRATVPILLVEHDMDAVFSLADRISVLVNGAVIATGSVAEIRSDAAVRKAYLGEAAPA